MVNFDNLKVYVIGFAIIAVICVGALYYGYLNEKEFGGADDGAEDVVSEYDPDFKSWTNGIWGDYELPGETESLLFALQAAIGALVIGYFIGRHAKSKN